MARERTSEYLRGEIKEWEEALRAMSKIKNLEDVKKIMRLKLEKMRKELTLKIEAQEKRQGLREPLPKFNFERYVPKRGRPKKKEARA